MSVVSEAFIVPPGGGRHLDLGNFQAEVLATSAQTDGEFSLLKTQSEPPRTPSRWSRQVLPRS